MHQLKYLYITDNRIQSIATEAFTGTENIFEIDLSCNTLSEVPFIGPQPRLTRLDLSKNQIDGAAFPSKYMNSYNNL